MDKNIIMKKNTYHIRNMARRKYLIKKINIYEVIKKKINILNGIIWN